MPKPLYVHSCRLVRKRCGVCRMPSNTAARIGPIEGDLAEQFPRLVFLALREQLPPHLLTHRPQRIELLVVKLGPPAHSRFADLPEPLGPMARCIDLLAGTRNGPTAIDRFHP